MRVSAENPRWWDLPAGLLLVAAILTSGTRLVATEWTSHLAIIQSLVFFGVIAGLMLGKSRFSPRSARFLAVVYGLFAVPWQLGITLPIEYSWTERMIILINRLQIIFSQLIYREPVRDSLLFLVVMFILYWGISVHAGYSLTRHGDAWRAIIPGGISMLVIQTFDPAVSSRIWYLAAYLFFGLILVARMTFVHQNSQWQKSRTALPPHISLDFIRYAILAVFVIVVFAWTIPALAKAVPQANIAWQPVRSAWNHSINKFENAFASLKATVFTYTTVYSPISTLGRGSALTDTQIFRAKAPLTLPLGARLYWRARVYDHYDKGQWRSTLTDTLDFNPFRQELPVEPGIGRWQGTFSIISASNITTLFTPAQPIWVSRAGKVEYASNPDGTIDVTTFSAAPSLGPGESYEILASIGTPTIEELRSAGDDYPTWISERYLQLPGSLTERTRSLAESLTAGLETPYDKALSITQYLRNNIQYVETLDEAAPSNQEPVDWFLFDSKKGFCNYYSSAEVLMLRAVGIPARWAVGYAQGELLDDSAVGYSNEEHTFIVRQREAHAWPEVFFPGYGWIEFEPTISQPVIERPSNAAAVDSGALTADEELAALREDKREQLSLLREQTSPLASASDSMSVPELVRLGVFLVIVLILLTYSLRFLPLLGLPTAFAILEMIFVKAGVSPPEAITRRAYSPSRYQPIHLPSIAIIIERLFVRLGLHPPQIIQRWARQSELPPLTKAYLDINLGLSLTGYPPSTTDTPAERASKLGKVLPTAEIPAVALANEYQVGTFSQNIADLDLAKYSAKIIRKLAISAYAKRFLRKFQKSDPSQGLFRTGSRFDRTSKE